MEWLRQGHRMFKTTFLGDGWGSTVSRLDGRQGVVIPNNNWAISMRVLTTPTLGKSVAICIIQPWRISIKRPIT